MGAALVAAFSVPRPSAHCASEPPVVQMSYPSNGVAVQNACFPGFGVCNLDTFYVDKLRDTMALHFKQSKYAVTAYVDSISNYLTYDTTWYRGEPYYVDTFQTEKVWITVDRNLKDSVLPVTKLSYIDRWVAFTNNPFSTTYTPLIDTPFVAFFTAYDSIRKLGIGPMDGCFFEPTAYTIIEDRIHRKGLPGDRMPGVSLPWEDFLKTVGAELTASPPVRPRKVGLRPQGRLPRAAGAMRGLSRFGVEYDLRGRALRFHRAPP